MTETWDDVNEQVKADWKDDTTPFERVYEIVEQTHDGQSAAEIASSSSWSFALVRTSSGTGGFSSDIYERSLRREI